MKGNAAKTDFFLINLPAVKILDYLFSVILILITLTYFVNYG